MMKKQNVRTISLIVCTFTYLLIGAAVFDAFESDNEHKNAQVLQEIESMIINRYKIHPEDYRVMEIIVLKGGSQNAGKQWKFAGAFYYATTVLTTIGYGHSTPHTIGGKMFTMAYALVGIPLGLVMFQSIGERLNNFSSFVIRNVKKMLKCSTAEATETDLIFVVTTLSTITIAGGAAAFSKYEGWTYFDSIYYCFVTLTTIGFGDMVALQQDNALTAKPEYVAFVLIFILFGLAIVAASLNLLVLRLVTLNTEDERRDEAEALQAAQGAVRLEGDVITANGSILSGQIPREQADGSLMNLDDSTSVCSCSCQCHSCFKWPFSLNGPAKTNSKAAEFPYVTSGYGALSSAGGFSVASLGCSEIAYDRNGAENQAEYYELRSAESLPRPPGGIAYSPSMTSPVRMFPTISEYKSEVVVRRGTSFSLRGAVRSWRLLSRRVMNHVRRRQSNRKPRKKQPRSRQNSAARLRIIQPVEGMIDIPVDDATTALVHFSTAAVCEKRASI